MNRADLQQIAELRLQEARTLLTGGFPDGAYYLAGYAVECALKACIAKRTKENDFPDQKLVNASYTHKLNVLLQLAQLNDELQTDLKMKVNWDIVQNWSEESRYREGSAGQEVAELLSAIEDNAGGGLLPWVRKRW
jgi:HEPN domain-containing protein